MDTTKRGLRIRPAAAFAAVIGVGAAAWLLAAGRLPGADLTLAELRSLPPIYEVLYHRADQQALLRRAEDQMVTECMARAGHTYRAGPAATAEGDALGPRPFGIEETADLGDGGPALSEPSTPAAPGFAMALDGDQATRLRVTGESLEITIPTTGCRAEAEVRLAGANRVPLQEARVALFDAERESLDRLETDGEYAGLRAEWAECMKGAGIDAADPAALPVSGPDPAADPGVRADLRCKADTDFLDRAYRRMAELQEDVLAETPGLLGRWRDMRADQVAEARTILSG
ncbi:hypothetical protein [Catenuloplanes atrovinosus]|uniref:Uncharacterized protein n=1 Tax=Catenuloplanes atrovinosus TaxID=137266 RepID=A0AAE3YSY5_9ACTN|nr:hypothetical protein [Catenuloplanes atrovinosus]MDR7279080.1 hypothetical protein [Catenuloplanes atrovinosus]